VSKLSFSLGFGTLCKIGKIEQIPEEFIGLALRILPVHLTFWYIVVFVIKQQQIAVHSFIQRKEKFCKFVPNMCTDIYRMAGKLLAYSLRKHSVQNLYRIGVCAQNQQKHCTDFFEKFHT